jgi:hypothetical protein
MLVAVRLFEHVSRSNLKHLGSLFGGLAKCGNGGPKNESRQPAQFFTALYAKLYDLRVDLTGIKGGLMSFVAR